MNFVMLQKEIDMEAMEEALGVAERAKGVSRARLLKETN